jgi:hypothetical protein
MDKDYLKTKINKVKMYWKILVILEGFEVIFLTLLLIAIVGFYLDILIKFSYSARYAFLIGSIVILLFTFVIYIIIPALRKISDDEVALKLEEKNPNLKSRLISAIQLKRVELPEYIIGSKQMIEALEDETIKYSKNINFTRIYKKTRLVILAVVFLGIVSAIIQYTTSYPEAVRTWFLRVIKPSEDIPPFSFTKLEISPKNCAIIKGDNVTVKVILKGVIRDKSNLYCKPVSGEWQNIDLNKVSIGKFAYTFNDVTDSFKYYVTSGDGKSNEYEVIAKERPSIVKISLVYNYPNYTGLPQRIDDLSGGEISAVYGTRVLINSLANTEIRDGRIVFKDGSYIKMNISNKVNLSAFITVNKDTTYTINLTSIEGFNNINPPEYTIKVLPDNEPLVEIIEPEKEISLTKIGTVRLNIKAADDFGVSKILLKYNIINQNKEESFNIPVKELGLKIINTTYNWSLRDLSLEVGNKIEYSVLVYDNNPNKIQVAESEKHIINIIDKTEMLVDIREKEEGIKKEIGNIIRDEENYKKDVEKFKDDSNIDQDDKNKISNVAQNQKDLGEQTSKISEKMKNLVEQRRSNEVASLAELYNRQNIQKELENIANTLMPEVANKIQETAYEEDKNRINNNLKTISQKQDEIIKKLSQIQNALGMVDALEELITSAQKLLVEEKKIYNDTKNLAKIVIGKQFDELEFEQLNSLNKIINIQKETKENTVKLELKTKEVCNNIKNTNPELSKGLSVIYYEYLPIEQRMDKIIVNLPNTKFSIAISDEENSIELLEKLVADLERLRKQKGALIEADKMKDPIEQELNNLSNKLDDVKQMIDQQSDLNDQIQDANNKNNSDSDKLKELAKQQADLKKQADNLSNDMTKDQSTKDLSNNMQDIGRKMEQARSQISRGELGSKTQQLQQQIIDQLNNIQSKIQDTMQKLANSGEKGEKGRQGQKAQNEQEQGQMQGQQGQNSGKGVDKMAARYGEKQDVNKDSTSWGDLPPELQREMIDSMKENFPIEYTDLLKAYYKKLSEK